MKRYGVAVLFLSLLIVCVSSPSPGQEESKRPKLVIANSADCLKSLQGVNVLVEGLSDEAKTMGLTGERLQTVAELKLRQSRIRILTKEEWRTTKGCPTLYINANVVGDGFNVSVEVHEGVFLYRDLDTVVLQATTWHRSVTGTARNHGSRTVIEALDMGLDDFCNDYLKANPNE